MSGSTKLLAGAAGAAGGGASTPFWTEKIVSSGSDYTPTVDYDSDGNVYFAWKSTAPGSNSPRIVTMYDSNGVQQWSKSIAFVTNAAEHAICGGSSYVYLAALVNVIDGSPNNAGFIIVALNKSDGSVAFQKFYSTASSLYLYPRPVEMAEVGNYLYIGANVYRSSTSYNNPLRIGIDLSTFAVVSGTIGDNMHYLTGNQNGGFMVYNSVANVAAQSFWDDTNNKTVTTILGTTGAPYPAFQTAINVGGDTECFGCTVDSSGNVYVAHKTTSATYGGYDIVVTKYNGSLSVVWNKVLGNTGYDYAYVNQYYGSGIACDLDDNIHVAYFNSTESATYIAKISSGGSVLGNQKITSSTSGMIAPLNIKSSPSDGKLYLSMANISTNDVHVAVLPTDLSAAGTYAGLTFGTGTVSITNRSYTTSSVSGLSSSPNGTILNATSNAATVATFDTLTRTHEVIT